MSFLEEEREIVIVGGGICGLATALALRRKGISSIVLERAESLRATGAAIGIWTNGWRALDQLGVGTKLRQKAIPIKSFQEIYLYNGSKQEIPIGKEELRCLKRSDLIETLAESLPPDTIHFGSQVIEVKLDPVTSNPILQLRDGSVIKAKVVIGCDGANSLVIKFLGLKAARFFSLCGVRGFTSYLNGHGFGNEFIRMRGDRIIMGRVPIDDNLVHWFIGRPWTSEDSLISKDPVLMKESSVESIKSTYPIEWIEMVKNSDLNSLCLVPFRYRTPWEVLLGSFRKGTVTVAGDSMHVMGPYLGQGGSAGLEDAIVLARCLAREMCMAGSEASEPLILKERIGEAIDQYVKERRMRLVKLSTQTYLTGLLINASSLPKRFGFLIILIILFGRSINHARYDCGSL